MVGQKYKPFVEYPIVIRCSTCMLVATVESSKSLLYWHDLFRLFLENSKDLIVLAQHVHRLLLQVTYHNAEFSIDTVQKGLTLQN